MTPAKQRIAIAEACGWTFEKKARCNMLSKEPAWHLISPEGKMKCGIEIWHETHYGTESNYEPFEGELVNYLNISDVPDYLNDLNACHEAEKVLTDEQTSAYITTLCLEVQPEPMLHHATAPQRCEAFLRVMGLWEEGAQ